MANKSDWSGDLGATWAEQAEVMERLLAPFGDKAMTGLGDIAGQRVLDLGCGGGATTLTLARQVGSGGAALGVDVSPDLIALAARRREAAKGAARQAGFLEADAATAPLAGPFDALYSQFGAMFFDAPIPAFINLRKAMRPEGRLSIACWQVPKKNGWAMLALNAAKPVLPPMPPADPTAPGPFAWADPDKTFKRILDAAGWKKITYEPFETTLALGQGMDGDPLEAAVTFSMKIGPLASRLGDVSAKVTAEVECRVRDVMAAQPRTKDGAVAVPGAAWIVSAVA
ncbi:MAG: class I SAM-dependent methyltransferase [Pseudomonadota bacterium]